MGISLPQILVVLLIIVLLFGARRLPELGKSMGEAIKGFKKGISTEEDHSIDVTNSTKDGAHKDRISEAERAAKVDKERQKSKV